MNTKIIFCIEEVRHEGFEKAVFEIIIPTIDFQNKSDACNWLENEGIIKTLQDSSYASSFMDYYVLKFEESNEECHSEKEIDRVKGKIVYEKDDFFILNPFIYEQKKKEELKREERKIEESKRKYYKLPEKKTKKEYPSLWMEPNGTSHIVGFAQHNEWAHDYYDKLNPGEIYLPKRHGGYAYEDLVEEGWVRILGWTDPPTWDLPKKLTPKQKRAIKEYCQNNSCKLPFNEE